MDDDPIPNIAEEPPDSVPLSEEEIKTHNLPSLMLPKSKTKSVALQQFQQLGRTDRRRLQTITSRNAVYYVTHLCIHCLQDIFLA